MACLVGQRCSLVSTVSHLSYARPARHEVPDNRAAVGGHGPWARPNLDHVLGLCRSRPTARSRGMPPPACLPFNEARGEGDAAIPVVQAESNLLPFGQARILLVNLLLEMSEHGGQLSRSSRSRPRVWLALRGSESVKGQRHPSLRSQALAVWYLRLSSSTLPIQNHLVFSEPRNHIFRRGLCPHQAGSFPPLRWTC